MNEYYEDVWELISSSNAGVSREEFEDLVKRVYERSQGKITKRAAAIFVARQLGVDTSILMYPPIRGRVLEVSPVKYSSSQSGGSPYVLFTLVNETNRFLCVAFGDRHIEFLRSREEKVVELRGYTRVKLRKYSMIKATERSELIELSDDSLPPLIELKPAWGENLKSLEGILGSYILDAVVVDEQVSEFFTCPECGRSVDLVDSDWVCPIHGVIDPQVKQVRRLLISDESGEYPAVYFGELEWSSILYKGIIFKGFMREGEIQINKIYKVTEEDQLTL